MLEKTPSPPIRYPQTLARRVEKLSALLEITRLLAAEISLDDLLHLIVVKTTEVMDAERSTVYLVDHEKGELWSKIAQRVENGEIRLQIDGPGLAAFVAKTGDTVNIADAYHDPRFNPELDRRTGWRTRNMLVMPMRNHQNRIIGVFQVMNKREGVFNPEDEELLSSLSASAAVAIENAQLYAEQKEFFESLVETLAATIDARDQQTAGHSERVTTYAVILAHAMGLAPAEVEKIRLAAVLHDYGKIATPDAILTKPGKLTDEEYHRMREHAHYTQAILSKVHFPRGAEAIPLIAGQHHERMDGRGGPDSLSRDQIVLGARIIALADVFEALTVRRYYKPPFPVETAVGIIDEGRDRQFDAEVVDAFHRVLPELTQALQTFAQKDPALYT